MEKEIKDYKNLGYVNSWKEKPIEVIECEKLGHKKVETIENESCTLRRCQCNECKYVYRLDSSG
jgi:Zn ribbon nucleic-acid-binding protein